VDVFASRQYTGVPDGVTSGAWLYIPTLQRLSHSTARACKLQTEERAEHDVLATDTQHNKASVQTCLDVTAAHEVYQLSKLEVVNAYTPSGMQQTSNIPVHFVLGDK